MLEGDAGGACPGLLPARAACLVPVSAPRSSCFACIRCLGSMHAVRRVTGVYVFVVADDAVRASPVAANPTLAA
jgi:hypothetical protein